MKQRALPRYRFDQKEYLASIETFVLQPAEAAGEEDVILQTKTARWLIELAKRARRERVGRPVRRPKHAKDRVLAEARPEYQAKLDEISKAPKAERPRLHKEKKQIIQDLANDNHWAYSTAEAHITRSEPLKPRPRKTKTASEV
jgi:hypothetical protein